MSVLRFYSSPTPATTPTAGKTTTFDNIGRLSTPKPGLFFVPGRGFRGGRCRPETDPFGQEAGPIIDGLLRHLTKTVLETALKEEGIILGFGVLTMGRDPPITQCASPTMVGITLQRTR